MKFKHMKTLNKSVGKDLKVEGKNIPEGDYYASTKFDGVLLAIRKGELLTGSLKKIPNKQLWSHFKDLIEECGDDLTLIGEIYSHQMTFQEIISVVMSHDKEVPNHIKLHCFDAIKTDNYLESFKERLTHILKHDKLVKVKQTIINTSTPEKFNELFQQKIKEGYEGLMIKSVTGKYKCGRTTLREGTSFKFKPYETVDGQIFDIVQATVVRKGAEKTINELGRSVTSKKKNDRVLIDQASAFWVRYNNMEFKVTIAEQDDEKKRIWEMRDEFRTGKHKVEFKAIFTVGVKDKPRHPTSLRLRMFEDEE